AELLAKRDRERRGILVADARRDLGDAVAAGLEQRERLFEPAPPHVAERRQPELLAKRAQHGRFARTAMTRECGAVERLEQMPLDPGASLHPHVLALVEDRRARAVLELLEAQEVDLFDQLRLEKPRRAARGPLADRALEHIAVDELVDPASARQATQRAEHVAKLP